MAYTVPITGEPETKTKKTASNFEYTDEQAKEKDKVEKALNMKEDYQKARLPKEKEWSEAYKMYMSWIDSSRNPFLSNLFIPKTHEAVESLSAFLIGTNQSIKAEGENGGDSYKALAAGKYLEFLWRKVLKARIKVLTWIKQGIVFGNGIVKVGWDAEKNVPFLVNTAIEDVYFDYFEPDLQDSEMIIHEIRRSPDDVKADEKYTAKDGDKFIREDVKEGTPQGYKDTTVKFSSYDKSLTAEACSNKVPILEVWYKSDNKVCTLAPTSQGWRILREVENPNFYKDAEGEKTYFRPFSKLRFKVSPIPNRAYDTGAVYPTVKIQRSFNDLMNQYFDNVVLINNAMWVKQRGARINPSELIRRPGGVITVPDITNSLRAEVTPDVKQSIIEMLNRLDGEFQQASMVVNLLKGIDNGASNTATEAQLGQQNVQTLLEMIDENIGDALSEVGDMVLAITLENLDENQSIKMFENDASVGVLNFNPKDLQGHYDVKISADRSAGTSKVVRQKQLLDFLQISTRPEVAQRYPNLAKKTLEKWLEEAGFHDTEYFFEEAPVAPMMQEQGSMPGLPGSNQMLTPGANMRSAQPPPVA